jgi:hypothetical protein
MRPPAGGNESGFAFSRQVNRVHAAREITNLA